MDDKEKMFDQYGFSEEEDASSAPDFGSFMNKVEGINTDSLKTPADPETTEEFQLSAAEAARRIFEDVVVEEKSSPTLKVLKQLVFLMTTLKNKENHSVVLK